MIQIQHFEFNIFQENTYVIWDDSRECIIIDPGQLFAAELHVLPEFIKNQQLKPKYIVLTHAHLDHIFGVNEIKNEYSCKVLMDSREEQTLQLFNPSALNVICPASRTKEREFLEERLPSSIEYSPIDDGEIISFGHTEFKVISTPGHSPGGVCFLFEQDRAIFTGDTLFAGSIGRTDNNQADYDQLMASLKDKLMTLDGDITVYPGHGPQTDIARERTTNPFIFGPSDEDFAMQEEE